MLSFLKQSLILSLLLLFMILFNREQAMAIAIGGELRFNTGGVYFHKELAASFRGWGEMEFFLPRSSRTSSRLVLNAHLTKEGADLGIKYLYLRRLLDSGHLTIGRQPISWSFGSMLNPLDYQLGLDSLPLESMAAGIDGLSYQGSFGQGQSLQLIASFPERTHLKLHELGYGARLRMPGHGYDQSFVLSYQPLEDDALLRGGLTYKGSLKDVGLYGLLGYSSFLEGEREDFIVQLGLDYSWLIGSYSGQALFLQAEYSRFLKGEITLLDLAHCLAHSGMDLPMALSSAPIGEDLLIINLSLSVNYFTSLGLLAMAETGGGAGMLLPYYTSEIDGDLEMMIGGAIFIDSEDRLSPCITVGLRYFY